MVSMSSDNSLVADGSGTARSAWPVALASCVAMMLSGSPLIIYVQSVFLVPMTTDLGWTRAQYFAPLFFAGLVSALLSPIWGYLVDRHGARPILIPCVALFGLICAGFGLVQDLLVYSILLFLALTLQTAHGMVFYAKIILSWSARRPGLLLGIALSGASAGGMLLPPVAVWLTSEFGWRIARILLGLSVIAVALPLVWAFVRSAPGTAKAKPRPNGSLQIPREISSRRFWLIALNVALMSVAVNGVSANMVPLLVDKGITPGMGALGISLLAGSSFIARFTAGAILDYSRSALIAVPWVLCGALGLTLLSASQNPVIIFPAIILVGIALGGEVDFAAYFIRRYFSFEHHGFLYGTVMGIFAICATTGPLLFGLGYQLTGANMFSLQMACGLVAVAVVPLLALGRYPTELTDAIASRY